MFALRYTTREIKTTHDERNEGYPEVRVPTCKKENINVQSRVVTLTAIFHKLDRPGERERDEKKKGHLMQNKEVIIHNTNNNKYMWLYFSLLCIL